MVPVGACSMVQYTDVLEGAARGVRDRTIDRLLALRAGLDRTISLNNKEGSFHLATWNIRDFGGSRLNPMPRLDESLLYIAEIISAFDLVAVQEVNQNMAQFQEVMTLLGPFWDYIVTDQSGNMERLAFVYDKRKISFRHVAAKVVLPAKNGKPSDQFNRSPFLVAFQAGWFKFNICTVHIYYGSKSDISKRKREIADVAKFFSARQEKDEETYILLGDFNILNPTDPTMKALTDNGFTVPKELQIRTALASDNYYDQIAVKSRDNIVEIRSAGCFKWQDYVFRDDVDHATYQELMPKRTKGGKAAKRDLAAYRKWRTWQISDHLPLWTEIKMDFTDKYLTSLKSGNRPLADFKNEERHKAARRPSNKRPSR